MDFYHDILHTKAIKYRLLIINIDLSATDGKLSYTN